MQLCGEPEAKLIGMQHVSLRPLGEDFIQKKIWSGPRPPTTLWHFPCDCPRQPASGHQLHPVVGLDLQLPALPRAAGGSPSAHVLAQHRRARERRPGALSRRDPWRPRHADGPRLPNPVKVARPRPSSRAAPEAVRSAVQPSLHAPLDPGYRRRSAHPSHDLRCRHAAFLRSREDRPRIARMNPEQTPSNATSVLASTHPRVYRVRPCSNDIDCSQTCWDWSYLGRKSPVRSRSEGTTCGKD